MIKIHVVVDSLKWKKKIKDIENYFKLKQKKFNIFFNSSKKISEFTIFLTSNVTMKNLNNKFRKVNKPTDVLSFPSNIKVNRNTYLGDIAISFEIVNKRSKKSFFDHELDKMWIHGYLHLKGYNHIKNTDFKKMFKKEDLIFKQLNF
tara:strand:- start:5171 stop:5611 length:441 start_codon:yes stop_codon:yes gene_type:complete